MLKIQTTHFYDCWKYYEENSLVGCHVAFRKTDSSRHADLVDGAEWQPMQPFR